MRISKIFVTVDAIILKNELTDFFLLLIKRKNEPFKNLWALPGGFVNENEDLETAAIRELEEETSIKINRLEQIGTFGKPFRDPRGHMISVAFFGIVPNTTVAIAADDASEVQWFALKELPKLAFDHLDIINVTLQKQNL